MQAIQTRYFGPTNSRGSRVKAFSEAFPRGVITSWDYSLGSEGNHDQAAIEFIKAKEWFGVWARGASPDNRGNVYVCVFREHSPSQRADCVRLAFHPAIVNGANLIYVMNPEFGSVTSTELEALGVSRG